jgi:pyocin large subunit-like protein
MARFVALLTLLLLITGIVTAAGPGFRTTRDLNEHFRKHGQEFGKISRADYLRFAQELRDAAAGGPVLEATRADGVMTRFDRRKGWFGAYNSDGTIRTFFVPAAGESYFRRQARR